MTNTTKTSFITCSMYQLQGVPLKIVQKVKPVPMKQFIIDDTITK